MNPELFNAVRKKEKQAQERKEKGIKSTFLDELAARGVPISELEELKNRIGE